LPPLYRREALEEIVDRLAALEVIDQSLYGHTSTGEHEVSAMDFRIP
jgi:hypothetical protein